MFQKIKNADPFTMALVKTCVVHALVAAGTIVLVKRLETSDN